MPEIDVYSPILGKHIDLMAVVTVGCFLVYQFARLKKHVPREYRKIVAAMFLFILLIIVFNM